MAPLGLQQQQQQQRQGAPLRGRRGGSFPLARAPAAHAAVAGRRLLTVSAAIKAKSRREICCSKTLVAQPDMIDKVHKMCADVTAFSEARMGDPTSGVKAFECAKDRWEENVFHFWERYESNVALGRHNTTPEVSQFLEQCCPLPREGSPCTGPAACGAAGGWADGWAGGLGAARMGTPVVPLLEGPVGMALYEWKDGQLGPVSLQGDVFGMPELTKKVEEQFGQLMSGLGKLFGSKK
ncbi:hypothetical protein MNEG_12190 [Monoraphidium neglectum]|uniref:ABM domain-containing protein n=1 Tax=Monoraphidium neglectum TaxID=145388 RepID=A0A0D2J7K0_9CHLO|nr:hypothetical protein MNEG_12190 [Monoraphidium neglectum]KIY95772.1 hypothetical protein MNEG_12190 [Monoraphidium neglectum]|eukprot:XP_013894792.1 hypothetical protein MNEG_12190 [Monoraphidium neglectum]